MWILYALLSAIFASATAILAKIGIQNINSNLATGIRTIVIFFMIWLIILFKGELNQLSQVNKHNIFFLVLSGITTGLSWLFYFKAIQIGKVSQVAMIDKFSVVLTLLFAALFLGDPLTPKILIAIGLIFSGILILIW